LVNSARGIEHAIAAHVVIEVLRSYLGGGGARVAVSRIMMQAQGGVRPLSFDAAGSAEPLLRSAATGWAGLPFELHQTMPTEDAFRAAPPPGQHQLRVIVDGSFEVVMRSQGRYVRWRAVPGAMSFHSGVGPRPTRVVGSAKALVVELSEAWLKRLLHEGAPPPPGIHGVADADTTACSLARAMCAEVERGAPTGALFADSLSMALLSYALDRVPLGPAPMQVSGALSDGQCRKLKRYIDERLMEELRLPDLASVCGLRPRHFTTLFRRAFGVPPHRYVLQRRLARGADYLSSSGFEIAEIALRTGFSSQSHFTTAFRRAFGVTPRRYACSQRKVVLIENRRSA
jgi:AraC family transcriptional regulator